ADGETTASRILSKQFHSPGRQFQGDRYCGFGNFDGPIELGGFFQVTICLAVTRCCQTHRQSPYLSSFTSTPEVRVLSSAGVTRPQWSYNPLRLPDWPSPLRTTFGGATSTSPGYPPLAQITSLHAVLTTPVDRNRCLLVPSLSARPSPFFRRVGIHIVT